MMEGNGKTVLAGIMDDLVRYTESHFAFEEAMMRKPRLFPTGGTLRGTQKADRAGVRITRQVPGR